MSIEERLKSWLQEEQEKKTYSLKSVQEIMDEVMRSLSTLIVPIQKQELTERISVFDDINLWMSICKNSDEKLATKIQEERNKLLDKWGISIQTFDRSFDEHASDPELAKNIDDLKYDLLREAEGMSTQITPEQYTNFLKDELYYLKNYESELDTLKQSTKPLRKRLIEARMADYAAKKNSISLTDVQRFMKSNSDKPEDSSVQLLEDEIKKLLDEHCEIPALNPLKKVIEIAKEQQTTQGIISADIVDSILEYIFESVNEKLQLATEQERKERRANFNVISVWVQVIQKYVKLAIELSDTELEKALKETCDALSGDIWEKSLTLYQIDVTQRLDEFSLKKKMESSDKPKPVTRELYLQFLDLQLDYLKNNVSELEEHGLKSLYLSERIRDYCAIKTGLEAEDIMLFAECNQDVLFEPIVMQKLFEIDNRVQKVAEVLDSKSRSSVDSDDGCDDSDDEY